MWGSISSLVASSPDDNTAASSKGEEGAPAEQAGEGRAEVGAADTASVWGSLASFAGGIKSAVDEQIAKQTAALEAEQAKTSAARKPAEAVKELPWASSSEAVQQQILALSEDERPFRQEPPSQDIFEFDLQESASLAMAACEWDDRLSQMRYLLVPSQIGDERFWRNYFYRARLIMDMPNLLQESPQAAPAPKEDPGSSAAPCASVEHTAETVGESPQGDEFISDNFMAEDDFESDAWRREMQAELGLDSADLGDGDGDIGAEWEKDLADELEDLQKEIESDI